MNREWWVANPSSPPILSGIRRLQPPRPNASGTIHERTSKTLQQPFMRNLIDRNVSDVCVYDMEVAGVVWWCYDVARPGRDALSDARDFVREATAKTHTQVHMPIWT